MFHPTAMIVVLAAVLFALPALAAEPEAEGDEFFEKEIRPILVERCLKCHSDEKHKGNLKLTSRESLLAGGETGPAAVEKNPDESLLVEAIGYAGSLKMPPDKKLPDADIARLTKWVKLGLPWPKASSTRPAEAERPNDEFVITDQQ